MWACCKCDAKFSCSAHLSFHTLLHSGPGPVVQSDPAICYLCNCSLDHHFTPQQNTVQDENAFVCWYCDTNFSNKKILEIHIKIEHGYIFYCNNKLNWFACIVCCDKLYMRPQDLTRHVRHLHQEECMVIEKYKVNSLEDVTRPCMVCGKPSVLSQVCTHHRGKQLSKKTLKKRSVSVETNFICWHCHENFVCKDFLKAHIRVEHGRIIYNNADLTWYYCTTCCDKLYMRSQDIIKHMRNMHGKLSIQTDQFIVYSQRDITSNCSNCNQQCILSKTCPKHKEKSKEKSSLQDRCDDFNNSVPMKCTEHGFIENSHSCQRCAFTFEECNHLWSHMFSKHKSKNNSFVCNLCSNTGIPIKNVTHLNRHMTKYHKKTIKLHVTPRNDNLKEKARICIDGIEMYKCPECGALLRNIWSLREHIMIHTGERPHVCDVCSKSFRNRGKLNVHYKRVHEQIRTHQCNHCGRAFSDKSNLTVHIRTHTDEKKYMCELCGAEFAQWATLYNHKFKHNNIKFKCTYCEKVYNNPSNLQRHIKMHSDHSLYICEVCGKDFCTARYLKRHKETHNSVNAFICEVCNVGFKIKKHLTQHHKCHSRYMPPEQLQTPSLQVPLPPSSSSAVENSLYKL